MKYNIFYLFVIAALTIGCSDEKDIYTNDIAPTTAKAERFKGEIPKEKKIHNILAEHNNYTLSELTDIYKIDTEGTEGEDYAANLKNIWLVVLNPKLLKEGTEEQKVFFINEQAALNNNLAHFAGFYDLLRSVKSLTVEQKDVIAYDFYAKNKEVVSKVKFHTAQEKKSKEEELSFAHRNFHLHNHIIK